MPPITSAKVRAVLRKAGYDCAKSHATRIRGWHSWSPGFLVRDRGGAITVEFMADHASKEREARRLAEYTAALSAAGLTVAPGEYGRLIVVQPETVP